MSNIYIFGDSNVRFFKEAITNWHDFLSDIPSEMTKEYLSKPEEYWTGHHSLEYMSNKIHFMWQTRFPAARVNDNFLTNKLLSVSEQNTDKEFLNFVFVFGRVDLTVERIKDIHDIEVQIPKFLQTVIDFSRKHKAKIFVCSAIISSELDKVNKKIVNHFNNTLETICSVSDEITFIDFDPIVGQDYIPEAWDEFNHPNREKNILAINHIIGVVNS
jgi:cellulose synthase/poly-beta-1,6-N-acetylglucosamine synthase-like glycosyltransferase